jgi:peptide chain release factor 1
VSVELPRARLDELVGTYQELTRSLGDPDVIADTARYAETARRHAELQEVVDVYGELDAALGDARAADLTKQAESEDDRELFRAEAEETDARADALAERLRLLLIPRDPLDDKDVIVEVRAGAGGDEAGLFAAELQRMYIRYAESLGWRTELLSASESGIGGVKEATVGVKGRGAWSRLKHESGVHRVQRVPSTESSGRIHTSTASVAVMPEAEDVDVTVDPNDLKVDVYRSSGPGGQSVNTTDSAVRITHVPTGLVVSMQDEKSQLQNREKALRVLKARLLAAETDRVRQERADERAAQIGTGDRSEKIRTYNFPQSRVTDHRIGFSTHALDDVLSGRLGEVVDALVAEEQRRRLESLAGDE